MLKNIRIGPRLLLLVAVLVVLLVVVGILSLVALRDATTATAALDAEVRGTAQLAELRFLLTDDVVASVNQLYNGAIGWDEARARLADATPRFETLLLRVTEGHDARAAARFADTLGLHLGDVRATIAEATHLVEAGDRGQLELFVINELEPGLRPFLDAMHASGVRGAQASAATLAGVLERERLLLGAVAGAVLLGIAVAVALGLALHRSIATSVRAIEDTVQRVNAGDLAARAGVDGDDELSDLGDAFDRLLDERVAGLASAQEENEQLNDSVISLLGAVAKLADKDLRVRVPVTEDVTGPLADGINLLSSETAGVLGQVRALGFQVASASRSVKQRADTVMELARAERAQVRDASRELTGASQSMLEVAGLAARCNEAADKARAASKAAEETVGSTVAGIDGIRSTVRDTEKRIKRLGERAQEISGAVNLVDDIAERTHILALNASMQAAASGEAGRGLSIVADEVQRLAENSREATREIASLVENIQLETVDTVSTMNEVISQVVKGTELSRGAGARMRATRKETDTLVALVARIAEQARVQADTSKALVRRALEVAKSTEETHRVLGEQASSTEELADCSEALVASVARFRLPDAVHAASVAQATAAGATVLDLMPDDTTSSTAG